MKHLLTLILSFCSLVSFGQILECGTKEEPNTLILSPQMSRMLAADPTIRTIPLVFHIVHNQGLYPGDSAFAASKIATYISIAQKFLRKQNADTAQTVAQFRPVMADAKIEFCLKQVIFKRTTEVSFTTNDKIKFLPTGSPAIDPLKHCNIWIGRLTGGLGGYAYFPSTGSVGAPFDGLVSLLPTSHSDESVAEIIVHELHHYLGIYHTFSGSCTGDGDFCADTPPTDSPSGCNLSQQKCGGLVMVQNVMDYAHCGTGQTHDQVARATATLIGLRNQLWNSGTCSGTPGNTPPTCSITFPTNNQNFPSSPSNITINVSSTDANGTVTKVEFYQGSTLLSTDLSQPYSFTWQGVTQGSYILTARATDNANATTTSNVVNITVGTSTAPTCTLISPVNGANYVLPAAVRFEATASDADGIAKVEFAINNTWININLTVPPYVVVWTPYVGTHQIKARATDLTGAVTISQPATITVTAQGNPPPVISITSPVNGATFTAPASVTITANATDNTSINRVEFYSGSTLWNTDNSSPYTFTRTNIPAGNYILTARAYDNLNASTVSSPVSITVTTTITSIPVIKTTIFPQTKEIEHEGNDTPPTKVRVKYQ